MAFSHGKNTVVKVDNSGGSLVDLSAYIDKSNLDQMVDTAETSTFGATSKTFLAGLQDGKISMEGPFDPVPDAQFNSLLGSSTTKSIEFYPQGTTAGLRKYTFEAILTSYGPDGDVGAAERWKAEFQVTGDITRTTA